MLGDPTGLWAPERIRHVLIVGSTRRSQQASAEKSESVKERVLVYRKAADERPRRAQ